ncbi:hypothetical protein [Parvicella tangerina]|uniref:Uncharacterized protein n=1 Tax=Parvicella tangerina TaxID=2829795 RepID=A0A916JKE3_9FLAO|nr:hypothetical protein [Parvicella tangerina]CAG5079170.1 hypothetical protein CRYO30217_00878 [Parvicella tangerina]
MARRSTLKDLNEFLSQNPNTIEVDDVKSKEDFINKSPNNLVDVDAATPKKETATLLANASAADIAKHLHQLAKKENKSFADMWLKVIEEGAKVDPLLKNTSLFKTIRTINQTTFNVAMEGISKFIKGQR